MSPQKENGYTPIANELFEAFYRCKLLEYERVIMMCIWRKTYGWNKKEDWIANSQFFEETGIPKPHITRTLKALRAKNIIVKDSKRVTIRKDYGKWLVEWRVTSPGNKVTSPGNKKLPHQVPTKERKQITKEITEQSSEVTKKDMSFRNMRKYKEDGHWNEPAIDADTGDEVADEVETEKAAEHELNAKIRHNLHLVEDLRGLPFGTGKDMAYHVKIYRELLKSGWSHETLITSFVELINSDYWKEKRVMGEYPGMNTLQSLLRNKKPV